MRIAVPKETELFECRVSATPETVKKLIGMGCQVVIEKGAGEASSITDGAFQEAGASIISNVQELYKNADVVLKVQKPIRPPKVSHDEIGLLPPGCVLIGLFYAKSDPEFVEKLRAKNITAFSLDAIPRIARAQRMDALSSQSNIAGYKSVIMGAERLKKMMPLMMTAAGTMTPARVLVLGAGVAGLQAIATAKRLGAVVEAFDTRPAVKEQVESLGGKFLQIDLGDEQTEDAGGYAKELSEETHRKEMELVTKHAKEADIIITTALIPGKPAPLLISEGAVKAMKEGSVIIDLAAEAGGNCAVTEKGKEIVKHGVTVVGYLNIPSRVPFHASQMYARNILNFFLEICPKGKLEIRFENEVVKGALITEAKKVAQEKGVS